VGTSSLPSGSRESDNGSRKCRAVVRVVSPKVHIFVTARGADVAGGLVGVVVRTGGDAAAYEVGGLDDAGFDDDDEAVDEAARRMSFARRSSFTCLRSVRRSSCSVVVSPLRVPGSTSACFTRWRNDSVPTPSWRVLAA